MSDSDYPLPEEITVGLEEARQIMLALYGAQDELAAADRLVAALALDQPIAILRRKLVPDFPQDGDLT
ncbi:MAG TPA: hypothetical protein VFV02_02640 [Acidimicrobiales bacterium]|nr:hypothetical protein [Acidimicrobiales bacterium]